ncbi:MAG: TrbC/VirB2 family protein [Oligoflexia bacterium]|nr:TrbC/VirB2 family protein [Oligoflexia bacterium]
MTNLFVWNQNPRCTANTTKRILTTVAVTALSLAVPITAAASVEGSLYAVQTKLVGTILPLAAICGLVVAGFSFVAGHANARQHLTLAIMGAIIGFGAESIVSMIRSLIS